MRCVISSNSVNIVWLLKCVIPCSPDDMGYIGENGGRGGVTAQLLVTL